MTFETDSKVNNSLTTDRTVPNMQRLRTISMRQTKDFLQPQKRTPTEKMFKTWATLGQPAECDELSLRWSFMSNIRMVRRSGHSWPRMATSASIVAILQASLLCFGCSCICYESNGSSLLDDRLSPK